MTGAWSAVTLAAVLLQTPNGGLQREHTLLFWSFVGLSAYFLLLSFVRTARGRLASG
jgi:phosphatidylcholine synthase